MDLYYSVLFQMAGGSVARGSMQKHQRNTLLLPLWSYTVLKPSEREQVKGARTHLEFPEQA